MSFFNDFLNSFNMSGMINETKISIILGVGINVVGAIKIIDFSDIKIKFLSNKNIVEIEGVDLKIKSISKGEILISGVFNSLKVGEK